MKPKISVIIPIYNGSEYIDSCLNSITKQSLGEIEIICVDDGSTDGTLLLLEEWVSKDERIRVIRQNDQGTGSARNAGIEASEGEYISFMDVDAFYPSNGVLELLYRLAKTYHVNAAGGSLQFMKDNQLRDGKTGGVRYTFDEERIQTGNDAW